MFFSWEKGGRRTGERGEGRRGFVAFRDEWEGHAGELED